MNRYRIWLYTAGRWGILDTYNNWNDVEFAFALIEKNKQRAVAVVRDSMVDRHLMEHGKLPSETKRSIADEVKRQLDRREALRKSPGEKHNGN